MLDMDSDTQPFEESINHRIEILRNLAQEFIGEVEMLQHSQVADFSCGINIQEEIKLYESLLIRRALRMTGGNQRKASRLLGLQPSTLNNKMKRYKIGQQEREPHE